MTLIIKKIVDLEKIPLNEFELFIIDDDSNDMNIKQRIIYSNNHWQNWRRTHSIANNVISWANENHIKIKLIRRLKRKFVLNDTSKTTFVKTYYSLSIKFDSLTDMLFFKLIWL